jgi:ribosomal protein L11 methyltransferase
MAFGAGTHPTTQQSLLLLQRYLTPGARVLDVGTGCGILAIAAALCDAGQVLARDIDPVAVDAAMSNIAANGVADRVAVEAGNLLLGVAGKYDLILANLVAPLLLEMLPAVTPRLTEQGVIIMAGIISHRAAEVKAATLAADLELCAEMQEGEWVALGARNT